MASSHDRTEATLGYVTWFRTAAPYINAHRDQTFVLHLGHRAVAGPCFPGVLRDVALLATVGVRVVLVYGIESLVDATLGRSAPGSRRGLPTDPRAMGAALDVAGRMRFEIEARLSMALTSVPLTRAPLRVGSGNFVHARPAGVRDGQDLQLSGEVRRVDTEGIRRALDEGRVVVLPPIGYSPSGELFNLDASELAAAVAIEMHAAKLIVIEDGLRVRPVTTGGALRELTLKAAREVLSEKRAREGGLAPADEMLERLANACRLGVRRGHLLDAALDGALVLELFTRDGVGTMIAADVYDETRRATGDDVGGIVELIGPLEASGALVRRPREKLEREIDHFMVMERDGAIIACAAVYPLSGSPDPLPATGTEYVELACLAVHPAYRKSDRGDALLRRAEQNARALGARHLLVLTTQAEHWFRERGFEPRHIESLPEARRRTYNYQRNSKVLVKALA